MSTTIFAKMKIFKMFINGWGLKFLRLYSRKGFFLLPIKERTKENCRCCDVVRGCESGATVEQSETGVANNVCPLRGKQPHERASFAGWRRSLCAAKRPEPPLWKWDVRRGGALLRPRRRGRAAPSLVPLAFPLLLRRAACPQAAPLCL